MHPFLLPKLIEASKAKKNDSKLGTMTMPKTMPVQNLLRYISFKSTQIGTPKKYFLSKKLLSVLTSIPKPALGFRTFLHFQILKRLPQHCALYLFGHMFLRIKAFIFLQGV